MTSYEDASLTLADTQQRRFGELLKQCIEQPASIGEIPFEKPLRELGMDSLGMAKMVVLIEDEYDILLPYEALLPEVFVTPRSLWEGLQEFLPRNL
ncbi:acyl carrier protein [Nonomuraea sp. NPDC050643]|uniref:acyl carrier protein n=1 Tax=Nonomuraea sp. NPDC050643 TaxID=3155660 RepID=UPI0033E120D2